MIRFPARFAPALAIMLLTVAALAANLKNESLGGFKLGDPVKTVTDKLGPPPQKKGPDYAGEATGEWQYYYRYPDLGLDFTFVSSSKQGKGKELRLGDIRAYGPATAKTTTGIGVGSTKAEVKKAYGSTDDITDEKEWCGLFIKYKGDQVEELNLSFTKMPE